jgi:hypothetical protein
VVGLVPLLGIGEMRAGGGKEQGGLLLPTAAATTAAVFAMLVTAMFEELFKLRPLLPLPLFICTLIVISRYCHKACVAWSLCPWEFTQTWSSGSSRPSKYHVRMVLRSYGPRSIPVVGST